MSGEVNFIDHCHTCNRWGEKKRDESIYLSKWSLNKWNSQIGLFYYTFPDWYKGNGMLRWRYIASKLYERWTFCICSRKWENNNNYMKRFLWCENPPNRHNSYGWMDENGPIFVAWPFNSFGASIIQIYPVSSRFIIINLCVCV